MPDHVVRQGECLAAIAHRHGFARPLEIWKHPRNKALHEARRGDENVLFPGDVLFIPEKREKKVSKPTSAIHTFKVKPLRKKIRIVVLDSKDQPITGERWELEAGGEKQSGETDGQGAVAATLPVTAMKGKLTVGEATWNLAIGHLNPVVQTRDEGTSGLQERLRNLGYLGECAPGRICEKTSDAIRRFQRGHDLPPTGKPDDATRRKVTAAHEDQAKPSPKPSSPAAGASSFTVKVVDALPETPQLCTLRKKAATKKAGPNAVSPGTTNVLAPARKGKCGQCSRYDDCLDNDYDFLLAVAQMASRLQGDAGAFMGIMHFETGHGYSPKIQNSIGATGLIQIIPSTAKGLGTTTDELKAMCRIEQLEWVEKYFRDQKRSYPTADYTTVRDVVLAVFEPIGLDPRNRVLGVSADVCEGPFHETVKKGQKTVKKTYWKATFEGMELRVTSHQRAVYKGNAGLDRDKDGFLLRDDYPAIVDGLLSTCAKQSAEKARELQRSLGGGAPEYQILRPGTGAQKNGAAT